MKLSKNFNSSEFKCRHCGLGDDKINSELVKKLQEFRDFLKKPIYILSGFRCKEYNQKVGGAKNSFHLTGAAADIAVLVENADTNSKRYMTGPELLRLLHISGVKFNGIGVANTYLHVDVRDIPELWFYDGVLKWKDNTTYYKKSSREHL